MGKLVVIEGSCDGVGKSVQYKLLVDRLIKDGEKTVTTHHFPSYGTYQGRPVEEYLKGNFGMISNLSPYFVNSLYAQDRAITWQTGLKQEYEKGNILVVDRYTTSSLIYQSSVIKGEKEQDDFTTFVADYEYNKLGLPEPDLVIFLHVPFEISRSLKSKRKANDGIKNDIHERDLEYLKRASDTSIKVAKKFNWNFIECTKDNEMRTIEDIHEEIYKLVKEKLY